MSGLQTCTTCPDHETNYEWVTVERLVRDAVTLLAGKLPADAVGIAGIPRSGMLPATAIATFLHLPLWEITEEGALHRLGHGSRGRCLGFPDRGGPLVVVDDTVYNGGAMVKARAALGSMPALYAAVYVRPEQQNAVDLYGRLLPSPHLLEWNWTNVGGLCGHTADGVYGKGVATDLDGVLCHDTWSGGKVGSPYMVPRTLAVPLIVTGRPERLRDETERWLKKWEVKYRTLAMLPDGVDPTAESIARHKADHFGRGGYGFFVESDPVQAELINRATGKPVVCPRLAKVFQ